MHDPGEIDHVALINLNKFKTFKCFSSFSGYYLYQHSSSCQTFPPWSTCQNIFRSQSYKIEAFHFVQFNSSRLSAFHYPVQVEGKPGLVQTWVRWCYHLSQVFQLSYTEIGKVGKESRLYKTVISKNKLQ